MSLELGRSPAGRDDNEDDESADVSDAATESDAKQPSDEGTADSSPRRSVLAPFMIGGGADDSLPEEASGDSDQDADHPDDDFGDAASDTGQDNPPEHDDAFSPTDSAFAAESASDTESAPDASTTAGANADPSDANVPATAWTDHAAADEESLTTAPSDNAETVFVADDDEDTTAARPADEETAAASDADDADDAVSQRYLDEPSTSGASGTGSLLGGAADATTGAPSTIPAPRSETASPVSFSGPRLDSSGARKAAVDPDEPLLEDAEELRANWLRLQSGFVDDPHEAVSDAADLVEHTAQALVGALRVRQQELREMWDGGRPTGGGTADDEDGQGAQPPAADTTEQLRLLMKRYRVLFNHICRS